MAEMEEFKFPDEKETPAAAPADELEIEVVDDMPAEDRAHARPMPKDIVQELEKDDLDKYSDDVKSHIQKLKKVWNDERREKERYAREKAEAERFAQVQFDENRKLKQRLGQGEQAFVHVATSAAADKLATAKDKLKQAYESGDSERITEAQEALTDAKIHIKEVEKFRPSLQEPETVVEQRQQVSTPQVSAPVPDQKAEDWRRKNTWFGADEEMTALALGLHEKLVRSGVDPRSDDYYRRVDETMRKRFPEVFEDTAEEEPARGQAKTTPRTKPAANVVAPVTRATSPRQVRLTTSQVALAKRLGLSNEQYAKELMKLENSNG